VCVINFIPHQIVNFLARRTRLTPLTSSEVTFIRTRLTSYPTFHYRCSFLSYPATVAHHFPHPMFDFIVQRHRRTPLSTPDVRFYRTPPPSHTAFHTRCSILSYTATVAHRFPHPMFDFIVQRHRRTPLSSPDVRFYRTPHSSPPAFHTLCSLLSYTATVAHLFPHPMFDFIVHRPRRTPLSTSDVRFYRTTPPSHTAFLTRCSILSYTATVAHYFPHPMFDFIVQRHRRTPLSSPDVRFYRAPPPSHTTFRTRCSILSYNATVAHSFPHLMYDIIVHLHSRTP